MHLVSPLRILRNHCFQILQGITVIPREIENNGYAKFLGANKVTGLSLRFQVAGYLLLVVGEVASSHRASPLPPPRSF